MTTWFTSKDKHFSSLWSSHIDWQTKSYQAISFSITKKTFLSVTPDTIKWKSISSWVGTEMQYDFISVCNIVVGYTKSQVHRDNLATIRVLDDNIIAERKAEDFIVPGIVK